MVRGNAGPQACSVACTAVGASYYKSSRFIPLSSYATLPTPGSGEDGLRRTGLCSNTRQRAAESIAAICIQMDASHSKYVWDNGQTHQVTIEHPSAHKCVCLIALFSPEAAALKSLHAQRAQHYQPATCKLQALARHTNACLSQ